MGDWFKHLGLWRPEEIQKAHGVLEFDWVIQNEMISVHDEVFSPVTPLIL